VFFGLGGYAIAMHVKLADLAEGEIPDFMQWSGRTALPFWWEPFHSPVFALAAALVGPALVAALFAWAVFHRRVSGTYFALITQALALAFATLIISRQDVTGGFNGLTNFTSIFGFLFAGPGMASALYWITLGALALSWLGLRWLLGSRFGTVLRAARDGENRVRFLGYDPVPFKVAAFALAAMLSGLGGALFTLNAGVISPALIGVAPRSRWSSGSRSVDAPALAVRFSARSRSISLATRSPAVSRRLALCDGRALHSGRHALSAGACRTAVRPRGQVGENPA
jgi:urea transport system permease protein